MDPRSRRFAGSERTLGGDPAPREASGRLTGQSCDLKPVWVALDRASRNWRRGLTMAAAAATPAPRSATAVKASCATRRQNMPSKPAKRSPPSLTQCASSGDPLNHARNATPTTCANDPQCVGCARSALRKPEDS